MSRKRRFRRKALGRLDMFFTRRPYTGLTSNITTQITSNLLIKNHQHTSQLQHYIHVTKKTIYHSNNKIC